MFLAWTAYRSTLTRARCVSIRSFHRQGSRFFRNSLISISGWIVHLIRNYRSSRSFNSDVLVRDVLLPNRAIYFLFNSFWPSGMTCGRKLRSYADLKLHQITALRYAHGNRVIWYRIRDRSARKVLHWSASTACLL